MKLKDFKLSMLLMLVSLPMLSQNVVKGKVTNNTNQPIANVGVYDGDKGLLVKTNQQGEYKFETDKNTIKLIFFSESYSITEDFIDVSKVNVLNKILESVGGELSEVEIKTRKKEVFALRRLEDVEETAIYAGKKNRGCFSGSFYGKFGNK
jgi:Fe(3+) dicitrate transport protein